MRTGDVQEMLHRALEGDARAVPALAQLDEQKFAALSRTGPVIVRPEAVVRILDEYVAGDLTQSETQAWASFIRRGYFRLPLPRGVQPIDIEYEATAEDAIIEAIGRLDELGDVIDGELRPGEAAELRAELLSHASV